MAIWFYKPNATKEDSLKMSKYKVIAICGKSSSGKDTFLQHILKSAKSEVNEIISFTTRPIRDSEIDGKNYYFISREEFIQKIDNKLLVMFLMLMLIV